MPIGRWILTPVSASQTNIQMEVLIDPEGWLPDWLVNMVQRTYPVGLLVGLRDYIDGLDFAPKRITVSTVGLLDQAARLLEETRVRVAFSLNASDGETRTRLMPVNTRFDMDAIVELVAGLSG